jgi:hypothetical protein
MTYPIHKTEREKEKKERVLHEAEQARFIASIDGENPKLRFRYDIFSEIDPNTKFSEFWRLSITFPFAVPKSKCPEFKEAIQNAFERIFLA